MKKILITSAVLSAVLLQPIVHADDGFVQGYVTSPYGEVYKNSYGECWRSRFDDTTDKLEECGYEKPMPLVIEKELVATQTAVTMTTTVADEIIIQAALLFAFDSAVLSDNAKAVLDERIAKYKGRGELTSNVKVIGHTDSTGPEEYNQQLSERRAKSVAEYLEQNTNITDDQIDAVGKGENEPKASNDTSEGRAINRRVIIILEGKVTQ
jgi:OOP family OmpA-OmpF porin